MDLPEQEISTKKPLLWLAKIAMRGVIIAALLVVVGGANVKERLQSDS